MKTTYIVAGLIVLVAVVAVIFVLSQPRTSAPGTLATGSTAGGAASTFSQIWQGLGAAGTAAVGAAES